MPQISVTWDGVTLECWQSVSEMLDLNSGIVVSLTIADRSIDSPQLTNHLHLIVNPRAIDANLAKPINSVDLPFNASQRVNDPGILHLFKLLQAELQTPQPMGQLLVTLIVAVLITHLLQNWQPEPCHD